MTVVSRPAVQPRFYLTHCLAQLSHSRLTFYWKTQKLDDYCIMIFFYRTILCSNQGRVKRPPSFQKDSTGSYSIGRGGLSRVNSGRGVKLDSPPSSIEIKKQDNYISASRVCLHVLHRDSCAFLSFVKYKEWCNIVWKWRKLHNFAFLLWRNNKIVQNN